MLIQASANKTVSITRDHSPDEESELLRIEMAGGKVTQEVRQVRTSCCGLWVRRSSSLPVPRVEASSHHLSTRYDRSVGFELSRSRMDECRLRAHQQEEERPSYTHR